MGFKLLKFVALSLALTQFARTQIVPVPTFPPLPSPVTSGFTQKDLDSRKFPNSLGAPLLPPHSAVPVPEPALPLQNLRQPRPQEVFLLPIPMKKRFADAHPPLKTTLLTANCIFL